MGNTCSELAARVLACCLEGRAWRREWIQELVDGDCSSALFRGIVEPLADPFEPRLCDVYAELFCEVIERLCPDFRAPDLIARYRRVREPRRYQGDPERVVVLSRVTLGADIAISRILLDASRRRFPRARICLAGGERSAELFPEFHQISVDYPRTGSIPERIAARPDLRDPGTLVIDPDSRLTQLGLLPVCAEDNYLFFESRSYGADGDERLSDLTARWAAETLGITPAYHGLKVSGELLKLERPAVAVNVGTGGNPAKRVPGTFESELIRLLAERFRSILIDLGDGGEEAARARAAVAGIPPQRVTTHQGSFASFASAIAQADCYVGYDSAGQHAAAALGVPVVTIFAGYPSERFVNRWSPSGPGPVSAIRSAGLSPADVLERVGASV